MSELTVLEEYLPLGKSYPVKSFVRKYKYEQQRPFRAPLPYTLEKGWGKLNSIGEEAIKYNEHAILDAFSIAQLNDQERFAKAHNRALTKVKDQLRTADSFFEDWYERKASMQLLMTAGRGILDFLRNWRKPHYWKTAIGSRRPADLPSAWLTYQFGIKPMVGSVDRALNLLGSPFPVMRVSGTSGEDSKDWLDYSTLSPYIFSSNQCTRSYSDLVKIGCQVTGINPNYALSGATGLGEPFSSAWSVIPWGWAVDYFLNVSELLSNLEDNHPGITTEYWYRTEVNRCTMVFSYKEPWWGDSIDPAYPALHRLKWAFVYEATVFRMQRYIEGSLYNPVLSFPKLGGNQAANLFSAIALTLKGSKK